MACELCKERFTSSSQFSIHTVSYRLTSGRSDKKVKPQVIASRNKTA